MNMEALADSIERSEITSMANASMILVVLSLFIGFFIKTITSPLKRTVRAMKELSQGEGDLTQRLNEEGGKELVDLAKYFNQFFVWLVNRTRAKFQSQRYAKYELLGLIVFIGIPLPMTGAWTGALAAWLFALKPRYAIFGFVVGLIMSATIVTAITQGVISLG